MSCYRTYLTLRGFSPTMSPASISELLALRPTKTLQAGEPVGRGLGRQSKTNAWMLSSEGMVESTQVGDHLRWLADRLGEALGDGGRLPDDRVVWDVFVFWESDNGQGGPNLDPEDSAILATYELPIVFDIYRSNSSHG